MPPNFPLFSTKTCQHTSVLFRSSIATVSGDDSSSNLSNAKFWRHSGLQSEYLNYRSILRKSDFSGNQLPTFWTEFECRRCISWWTFWFIGIGPKWFRYWPVTLEIPSFIILANVNHTGCIMPRLWFIGVTQFWPPIGWRFGQSFKVDHYTRTTLDFLTNQMKGFEKILWWIH